MYNGKSSRRVFIALLDAVVAEVEVDLERIAVVVALETDGAADVNGTGLSGADAEDAVVAGVEVDLDGIAVVVADETEGAIGASSACPSSRRPPAMLVPSRSHAVSPPTTGLDSPVSAKELCHLSEDLASVPSQTLLRSV